MNIEKVISPIYSREDNSAIDCLITVRGIEYPYTATDHDWTDYGIQLWDDLNAGKYGVIAPMTVSAVITQQNNKLLSQIAVLEHSQTLRRERENAPAGSFLANLEIQISALRAQLK